MTFKHKITGTQAKLAEDGKYYIHNCSIGIPKQSIEDNGMWYKEDGFEILNLITKNKCHIIHKVGYTFPECFQTLVKANDIFDIHSVKRLCDSEVLTLGDKYVAYNGSIGGSISEFRLVRGEIYINCVNIPLNDIQKVGEPLFKTQDGVELFGGESIYGVTDDFQLCYTSIATKENVKGVRIFAKKENAEKYIKENKPQYSLNDIRNVLTKQMECTNWVMIDVDKIIKDLEKQK